MTKKQSEIDKVSHETVRSNPGNDKVKKDIAKEKEDRKKKDKK